jgi:Helix-turn-helix domain
MADEITYSVYQAARELGCSSQWIRILLGERRLPGARKLNGAWVIPKSALEPIRQRREASQETAVAAQ